MKILGIVAEYNPFHNGHKYHIDEAKKIVKPDVTICIMSGNFVQRGEPAIFDKFTRANIAINHGIDLMLELPTVFAIQTAEHFASAAVNILKNSGVTHLAFGCECDDLALLTNVADFLLNEPESYKVLLKENLKNGISFPEARFNAMNHLNSNFAKILKTPNNILAVEYIKAIKQLNADIIPVPIKRSKVDYHSLTPSNNIASATCIRNMIQNILDVSQLVPYKYTDKPVFLEDFNDIIMYKLRTSSIESLKSLFDMTEGLENRFINSLDICNITDFINNVKTKRYPESRIKRILINLLLNITKDDIILAKNNLYIRVLASTNNGKQLLSDINKFSSIPVIVSINKFLENASDTYKYLLQKDINATNIYNIVRKGTFNADYHVKL